MNWAELGKLGIWWPSAADKPFTGCKPEWTGQGLELDKGPPPRAAWRSFSCAEWTSCSFTGLLWGMKWEMIDETLAKDSVHQAPIINRSLLPLKGHQHVPGCFREVLVSTVIRVSFTATLCFASFWRAWGVGPSRLRLEMLCLPGYIFSHLCSTHNLLAKESFLQVTNLLLNAFVYYTRRITLSSFPFWAEK